MNASEPVYVRLDSARAAPERARVANLGDAADRMPATPDRPRLGEMLVRDGVIDEAGVALVVESQDRTRRLFGETAIELRLVDQGTVARALAEQAALSVPEESRSTLAREVVAALDPFAPVVEDLRALRTRLLLLAQDARAAGRAHVLSIVSPEHGEGRSWLAANLAVVYAQLGRRTVLVDADLRRPRLHRLFGDPGRDGLAGWLAGRTAQPGLAPVPAVRGLELLAAGYRPPNPQELLSSESFGRTIAAVARDAEVVIVDTPPAGRYADFAFAAVACDAALLVARRNRSRQRALRDLAERLGALGRPSAGVVFNDKP